MYKITVVVGTYKKPKSLGKTIKSLLLQSYTNFHIIIIDDNHPDELDIVRDTYQIVKQFPGERIRYIKNNFNIGVPFVFKKWIDLVKTKYFLILGDGDCLHPNALDLLVDFLEKHPQSSMVHGLEITGNGNKRQPLFDHTQEVDSKIYLTSHLLLNGRFGWSQAEALYRTEFFKIKNIPVVHDHYWDFYFHCKYLLFSDKIGYLNEYIAVREYHGHGLMEKKLISNSFLIATERTFQSLKFLKEHETYMLLKDYSVARFKLKIASRLFKQGILNKNINQSMFCIGKALGVYVETGFSLLIFIITYPIKFIKY